MCKYTKPDLRISPIWVCANNDNTIYYARKDGKIEAIARKDGSEASRHIYSVTSTEWTPLIPFGEQPPLVIEPGRWYETRGKCLAFVGYRRNHFRPFVGHCEDSVCSWREDGSYNENAESSYDLIREVDAP